MSVGVSDAKREPGLEKDLFAWVVNTARNFWATSPENSIQNAANARAFEEPLVGCSNGSDPLYQFFKQDIGNFYMTPWEAFQQAFPESDASADQLSVISWILPQTESTKADNRRETLLAADAWARSKLYGNGFIVALQRHLIETLRKAGFEAVAPTLLPSFGRALSDRYGIASRWSERHAAYVSGLGTFGLCDGLITPRGKAMRCGSLVARIYLPPTPRPYTDYREYCLHFSHGACGACVKRCPVAAINERGHDKQKCRLYLNQVKDGYLKPHLGLDVTACGLCQTAVPCESMIPAKTLREAAAAGREL